MLHPQLLSELEELLRQKGLLENDPQSEIVPKAPVFKGAAPSMPLACPNCEEDDNTSYFDDILGLLNNREADEGRKLEQFVANALNPAHVVNVFVNEQEKACRVVVPDNQLSLAIGKEGQNARLAARLSGWKIDIKSQSQIDEQVEAEAAEAPSAEGDAE